MKEYIEERAVAIANYIIDYNATVRQAARKFGISKSTVHKDVAEAPFPYQSAACIPGACSTGHQQSGTPYPGAGWRRKKNMSMSTSCARAAGTRNRKAGKLELKAEKGAFRLDGRSAIFSASLQTISKYAIVASIHEAICQPDSGIWQRRGERENSELKDKKQRGRMDRWNQDRQSW